VFLDTSVGVSQLENLAGLGVDIVSQGISNPDFDTTQSSLFTWAVWQPTAVPVPEPTTIFLLASGLIGLTISQRAMRH
jgi:hypothetical protein